MTDTRIHLAQELFIAKIRNTYVSATLFYKLLVSFLQKDEVENGKINYKR